MVGEALAGLSALKTAFDLAKGLKDIDNATTRNAAVIELQEKILAAQETQAALTSRIGELEKEVANLKAWDAEKKNYELKSVGGGCVAYMLKPSMRGTEPAHWLCPNCYAKGMPSFFQASGARVDRAMVYRCTGCQGVLTTENEPEWIDEPATERSTKRKPLGTACPRCGKREYRIERSEPHPAFGDLGGVNRHMKCDGCGFTETQLITPT